MRISLLSLGACLLKTVTRKMQWSTDLSTAEKEKRRKVMICKAYLGKVSADNTCM